jgi:uncharacterized membrane protein YeiH
MASSTPWELSQVRVVIESVATGAIALTGVTDAERKRLDAVGLCAVGGPAAFDGITMATVAFGRVSRDVVCKKMLCAFHDRRPHEICFFGGGWGTGH